jgi:hypothetical protein
MDKDWVILMIRYDRAGNRIIFPMTDADEDETMATFSTSDEAAKLCGGHFLAKSSQCLLVNIETGETETL